MKQHKIEFSNEYFDSLVNRIISLGPGEHQLKFNTEKAKAFSVFHLEFYIDTCNKLPQYPTLQLFEHKIIIK